ncbi:hypothetical protein PLANPX_4703 [Lacipirellula parvula]|uniref:Uncharacterized protein n=1 Tax=Lacipirellula parvula TaxID=2650471 RepID=A0A5K7XJ79_9BACT|nr:hypothetical protein PLANPX_4703 [Lacipirellula parvula]
MSAPSLQLSNRTIQQLWFDYVEGRKLSTCAQVAASSACIGLH